MNIQGFQKLTLLDFPGKMACTVFTGGCNLRCPFCHNAGLVLDPVEYDSAEDEVLEYLEKRKNLLDGVCVTGGEPLLQKDLASFLKKVKDMGYLVKLDTNGSMPDRLAEILSLGLVDYVAMDIKSAPFNYSAATGIENIDLAPFKKSVELIINSGVDHEFRTTVVKGLHTIQDIDGIARWLEGEEKVFLQGYVDSGNILSGSGLSAFSEEEMKSFLCAINKRIPHASLRGQD